MFRNGGWRLFLAGVLTGMILMAMGTTLEGWKPRSEEDAAMYDGCLAEKDGNKIACDAILRMIERERIAEAAMLKEAEVLLAAGFSKREVVKWAADKGFVGSQLSKSVGITLQELQSGKY
jgi:hypothetical protein